MVASLVLPPGSVVVTTRERPSAARVLTLPRTAGAVSAAISKAAHSARLTIPDMVRGSFDQRVAEKQNVPILFGTAFAP